MLNGSEVAQGTIVGGRYRIDCLIGTGGMSSVYLALDLKLPGKRWAIKKSVVAATGSTQPVEEAEVLISLHHHRLPRIVDFIQMNDEGYCYLVMDYVEGVHLDEYVRIRKRLSCEELVELGMQICEGLQYLHGLHPPIIYRDLKPSNLLIDSKREITFIDFGIARTYKHESLEDTVKLGTVGFAAPEQYGGRQTDERSDLYSLGALLTYLATGCQYTAWTEVTEKVLYRNGCSAITPVLIRLLQIEPKARYQSANEVAGALQLIKSSTLKSFRPNAVTSFTRRPFVIAVMGTSSGVGVTHLAVTLSHLLSRQYMNIAIIEMDLKSTAFTALSSTYRADGNFSWRRSKPTALQREDFRIEDVCYIRAPSKSELLGILSDQYEFVICDLGSSRRKDWMEEFLRADLSILVTSAAVWRRSELAGFTDQCPNLANVSKWICFVPFASKDSIQGLRKEVDKKEIFSLPSEPDPFSPCSHTEEILMETISHVLPEQLTIQRSGHRSSRKKWRRHD